MEFEARKKVQIHLNVTPLIDIVFLLLIFFMLTANFIKQPGIKVNLPDAKHAAVQDVKEAVVTVSESGIIFVNDKETNMDDLERELVAVLKAADNKSVILKVDSSVAFGPAVAVMDIVKKAEASGIIISTDNVSKNE